MRVALMIKNALIFRSSRIAAAALRATHFQGWTSRSTRSIVGAWAHLQYGGKLPSDCSHSYLSVSRLGDTPGGTHGVEAR